MIQDFISNKGKKGLSLFFAGWGMDKRPFGNLACQDMDIMICYDYTDTGFDYRMIERYGTIMITAWSMGVWAAGKIIPGLKAAGKEITRATAINGTLLPVNDLYGIPEKIFSGTLEGLSEKTLEKFRRRMCGDTANYELFMSAVPLRSIGSLHGELAAIYKKAASGNSSEDMDDTACAGIIKAECQGNWNDAVICTKDRIFPADNQIRFWTDAGIRYELADRTHYCNDIISSKITGR